MKFEDYKKHLIIMKLLYGWHAILKICFIEKKTFNSTYFKVTKLVYKFVTRMGTEDRDWHSLVFVR